MTGNIRRADQPSDYQRFGIDPRQVQAFEDARRIGDGPGCYEWWYFDARLANGASVVVMFFSKPITNPGLPDMLPVMSVKLLLPGKSVPEGGDPKAYTKNEFKTVAGQIGVAIGTNFFTGDLARYQIEADVGQGVAVKLAFERRGPSARVGTGHLLFEDQGADNFLGWVVPILEGNAEVSYTGPDGVTIHSNGTCYHDHNWGDRPLGELVHHWYWGRATVGDITFSVAQVVCQAAYGSATHTDIVLLENGKFLACGHEHASCVTSAPVPDPVTNKPVSDVITFTFDSGAVRYELSFERQSTPVHVPFGEKTAYHRFEGDCTVVVDRGQGPQSLPPVKTHWEMMWFDDAVVAGQATAASSADAVAAMNFYLANMAVPRR